MNATEKMEIARAAAGVECAALDFGEAIDDLARQIASSMEWLKSFDQTWFFGFGPVAARILKPRYWGSSKRKQPYIDIWRNMDWLFDALDAGQITSQEAIALRNAAWGFAVGRPLHTSASKTA